MGVKNAYISIFCFLKPLNFRVIIDISDKISDKPIQNHLQGTFVFVCFCL